MTTWTSEQLAAISAADELHIVPARADGTLRPEVTIWVVRVDDDLYVRTANGRGAAWYRHLSATLRGQIRSGGVESDVTVEDASDSTELTASIQAEYHRKYDHYGEHVTRGALSLDAQHATWRLRPV